MRLLACGLLLSLAMLGSSRPVGAGDAGLANSETFSGFQFNFNNPGARALGMGGAFVAVADDATAVVANPAGLTILQRPEISAEYKFTRFRNNINAFTNTPDDGNTNTVHSRDFDDSVNTPSFFSFVYPTERAGGGRLRPRADQLQEHLQHRRGLPQRSRGGAAGLPPGRAACCR